MIMRKIRKIRKMRRSSRRRKRRVERGHGGKAQSGGRRPRHYSSYYASGDFYSDFHKPLLESHSSKFYANTRRSRDVR